MESLKAFAVKYLLPIGSFLLAIFSYSYYQKIQEAKRRAQQSNEDHKEQLDDVKEKVEDVKQATVKVEKAIEKVNEIKPAPVTKTDSLQESIDDFNK